MTYYDEQDSREHKQEREFRRILGDDAVGYYQQWYALGRADDPDDPEGSRELLEQY